MKIRTDFVTNSSSSSFVVDLTVEFEDGKKMEVYGEEYAGDYDSEGIVATITDENGEKSIVCSAEDYCGEELEIFDPEDIPWEVHEIMGLSVNGINLSDFNQDDSVEDLKKLLLKPFGLDKPFRNAEYDDDEEFEYEDEFAEEIIEALRDRFDEIVSSCNDLLNEHTSGGQDIKSLQTKAEFGGRGEMLANPDEILQKIFGYEDGQKIYEAIDESDEEAASEKLADMECLKKMTKESLENLISFVKECDCTPDECTVLQKVLPDGKVEIDIDYTMN